MFDRKIVWQAMLLLAALAMVIAMTGCGDDDDENTVSGQQTAFLTGAQANPDSNSLATSTATVSFLNLNNPDPAKRQIKVHMASQGLVNVTTVVMGLGDPGVTGPVLFTLFNRATSSSDFPSDFTRVINASEFVPVDGINNFDELITAIRNGRVYIQVNTVANPDGEIRGQIGASRFVLSLTGRPSSNLVPTALVTVDQQQNTVRVQMPNVGVPDATAVRLVFGGLGGPQLFSIREQPAGLLAALDVTLRPGRLNTLPAEGINNFNDFLDALYAGEVYLVIFTASFPGGEYSSAVVTDGPVLPEIVDVAMTNALTFNPAGLTVPVGTVVRFTNNSGRVLAITPDATNLVPAGPNSASAFPSGIPLGGVYDFQVPAGAAVGTSFFYHEPTNGTAGTGTAVGTGMAGGIRVIAR